MTDSTWIPKETFATRLAAARLEMGLSQRQMAERCGLDSKTWSTWERGVLPHDMSAAAEAIEAAVGLDATWLLTGRPHGGRIEGTEDLIA